MKYSTKPEQQPQLIDLRGKFARDEVKISGIEVQKKNKTRFSLFVEEEFLFGVSDSALVHFNLRKGGIITQKLIDEIHEFEQHWTIKEYLIRLLGRRDHARNELLKKGLKKGYSKSVLETILDELSDKGYINNRAFATKFAREKFRFNHWGAQKIRLELIQKGIRDSDIEIALEELNGDEELEKIEYLVQKSTARFLRKSPEKRKKSMFDFLIRKGFDSNVILKHLDRLISKLEQ